MFVPPLSMSTVPVVEAKAKVPVKFDKALLVIWVMLVKVISSAILVSVIQLVQVMVVVAAVTVLKVEVEKALKVP